MLLAYVKAWSSLAEHIKATQSIDPKICKIVKAMSNGKTSEFTLDQKGVLRCGNRLCVLDLDDLKRTILEEAHNSK